MLSGEGNKNSEKTTTGLISKRAIFARAATGNPGSVIVPQYGSSKIAVFVWGKNIMLKFLGNTKERSIKLTLQLIVVVLIAPTKFRDNLL